MYSGKNFPACQVLIAPRMAGNSTTLAQPTFWRIHEENQSTCPQKRLIALENMISVRHLWCRSQEDSGMGREHPAWMARAAIW